MQIAGAPERPCEPPECSSLPSRLTREQVVDRIIHINPSATAKFLDRFKEDSLETYLQHLLAATGPRGPQSRWVRPGDTPAILARESED
jgi:hypothetical protein